MALFPLVVFADGPELVCENTVVGCVYSGYTKTFNITIENHGNKMLKINKIKTSCTCTTVGKTTMDILPDQFSVLQIDYKPQKEYGAFSRKIIIISNDPANPQKIIDIKGNIIKPSFSCSNTEIALFSHVQDQNIPNENIVFSSDKTLKLVNVDNNSDMIAVHSLQIDDNSFKIIVEGKRQTGEPAIYRDMLKIAFWTEDIKEQVEIPVTYEIKPRIVVYPPSLKIGRTDNIYYRLLLKSDVQAVNIERIDTVGIGGIEVSFKKIDNNNFFIYAKGNVSYDKRLDVNKIIIYLSGSESPIIVPVIVEPKSIKN